MTIQLKGTAALYTCLSLTFYSNHNEQHRHNLQATKTSNSEVFAVIQKS